MKKLDLALNSEVYCAAEKCGTIARVAIAPETWEVKEIVVDPLLTSKESRVLPVTAVQHAADHTLHLAIDKADLFDFPQYCEYETDLDASSWLATNPEMLPAVATDAWSPEMRLWSFITEMELASLISLPWEEEELPHLVKQPVHIRVRFGVSPGLEVIGTGMPLHFAGEEVGRLADVVVQPGSGAITHLVAAPDTRLPYHSLIPINQVEALSDGVIYVTIPYN